MAQRGSIIPPNHQRIVNGFLEQTGHSPEKLKKNLENWQPNYQASPIYLTELVFPYLPVLKARDLHRNGCFTWVDILCAYGLMGTSPDLIRTQELLNLAGISEVWAGMCVQWKKEIPFTPKTSSEKYADILLDAARKRERFLQNRDSPEAITYSQFLTLCTTICDLRIDSSITQQARVLGLELIGHLVLGGDAFLRMRGGKTTIATIHTLLKPHGLTVGASLPKEVRALFPL